MMSLVLMRLLRDPLTAGVLIPPSICGTMLVFQRIRCMSVSHFMVRSSKLPNPSPQHLACTLNSMVTLKSKATNTTNQMLIHAPIVNLATLENTNGDLLLPMVSSKTKMDGQPTGMNNLKLLTLIMLESIPSCPTIIPSPLKPN